MTVRYAVLALLSEGPKYGLQLRQEFEAGTGEVWPLNVGQVYTTLQRLERDGLIEGDDDTNGPGGPEQISHNRRRPPGPGDMLVALGVLAMTVGLIRNEASGDLRTLTATGATGRVRRTLTAATAAGLALFGALLGSIGAYLDIAASYVRELSALGSVPIAHLATIAVGVPPFVPRSPAGW